MSQEAARAAAGGKQVAGSEPPMPIWCFRRFTQPVRAVVHGDGRDAQPLHSVGGPEIAPNRQGDLFFQGHLADQLRNLVLNGVHWSLPLFS